MSRKTHFSKFSESCVHTKTPESCCLWAYWPAQLSLCLLVGGDPSPWCFRILKSYRKICPPYYVASLTAEIFSMFIKRLISTKTVLLFSRALLIFEFTFCPKTSFFVFYSSYLLIFDKICMLSHIRWHQVIAIYLIFQDKISNFPAPSCGMSLWPVPGGSSCPGWKMRGKSDVSFLLRCV